MRILVVAAHPDDETLGAGGMIARSVKAGTTVWCMAMTDGVGARGVTNAKEMRERLREWRGALAVLGAESAGVLDYPDNQLDTVPMLKLAKRVEGVVEEIGPRLVITHSAGDLNVDHRLTAEAVKVACRPLPGRVIDILSMEIPSSTEWGTGFSPTCWVKIDMAVKRIAVGKYVSELREEPHPRSEQGVLDLASLRGKQCGFDYAEAFEVVRTIT